MPTYCSIIIIILLLLILAIQCYSVLGNSLEQVKVKADSGNIEDEFEKIFHEIMDLVDVNFKKPHETNQGVRDCPSCPLFENGCPHHQGPDSPGQ